MSNTFIDVFGYESSSCDLSDARIYDYTSNNGISGVSGVIAKTSISFNYPDWHKIYEHNGLVIYVKIANNRLYAKATIDDKSVEDEMTYSVPVSVYLGFLWDETANGKLIFLSNTNNESSPYWFCGGLVKQGSVNIASDLYTWIANNPYDSNKSGGAGSGYIGNSLLSNKKMVGYNVPTSSAESTKTESVNEASENPVSGKPKIGNGYARIKFLREPSVSVNIDIEAANQLKYNNVSPTFRIGSMGSYDSESQSYFFSQDADMTYGNLSIPKQAFISATQLSFECEAKVMSTAYGSFADVEFYFHGIEDGGDLIECVVSNGNNEGSSGPKIALNNGGNKWGGNAPLDMSGYRGAFHKVKYVLSMSNGKVLRAELYIDNALIGDNDFNIDLNFRSNNNYTAFFGATDNSYIKSYKVTIIGGV